MTTKHMDYIYKTEDYYKHPKEYFKFILKHLMKDFNNDKQYTLLDIGCSRGEFIYYINKFYKKYFNKVIGIDYSPDLIKDAKKYAADSQTKFFVRDAQKFDLKMKFDFITINGVVSMFTDLTPILKNSKKHLKPDGKLLIFHFFNSYDIDTIVKYRNNKYFHTFEDGWNMHSLFTVKKTINKNGMNIINQKIFKMPFKLGKKDDPGRSWTIETEEGRKFVNGLNQIYDLYLITIKKICFKDVSK